MANEQDARDVIGKYIMPVSELFIYRFKVQNVFTIEIVAYT